MALNQTIHPDATAFAARPETTGSVKGLKPYTGKEFIDSMDDGREIYIYGERVKNISTHPAFRNTAKMVARLYDGLHDPKYQSKLMLPSETPSGQLTHAFYKAPSSLEELVAGRDAIATWARMTYGWMGRTPDYK